jgi:hypothetical protein
MTKAEFPADALAAERKILEARAAESGKPPEIVAKMVEGGINKFLAENTLMGQPFVKDDKQTVEKMLAAKKTKLNAYKVLVVGEGIEKKQSDFAAEVAAMTSAARAWRRSSDAGRPQPAWPSLKLSGEALMGGSFGINRGQWTHRGRVGESGLGVQVGS